LRDGERDDAAIAVDAVLCVVYPHTTSVGGDLMAIVWAAGESSPVGLIGAGRSGELATIEAVRDRGFEHSRPAERFGHRAWHGRGGEAARAIRDHGSARFLDPAAGLAQDGYLISKDLAEHLKRKPTCC
jgi:gamma-glutamyltranspeptidase/glutathione hydrolase